MVLTISIVHSQILTFNQKYKGQGKKTFKGWSFLTCSVPQLYMASPNAKHWFAWKRYTVCIKILKEQQANSRKGAMGKVVFSTCEE